MAVSMSSSICSFSGFVLVIFISLKCLVGSFWVAVVLVGNSDKGLEEAVVVEALESSFKMN